MQQIDLKIHILEVLHQELPPIFSRKHVEEMTGKLIRRQTLANLDSKGDGPPLIRLGKKVGYEKDSFLKWIEKRLS